MTRASYWDPTKRPDEDRRPQTTQTPYRDGRGTLTRDHRHLTEMTQTPYTDILLR